MNTEAALTWQHCSDKTLSQENNNFGIVCAAVILNKMFQIIHPAAIIYIYCIYVYMFFLLLLLFFYHRSVEEFSSIFKGELS